MSYFAESTKPMPGRPVIFSTPDYFGNMISLHAHTWFHILEGHEIMRPYQDLIEPCLVVPTGIRESTDSHLALVFEAEVLGLPPEDLLRVVVKYTDGSFMGGTSTGIVTTAYPVDSITYPSSQVGIFVYEKESNITGGEL